MTEAQQFLVGYMENFKAMRSQMDIADRFHFKGMEHFLLEHGRWYEVEPWTGEYDQGAPRQCFGNAILLGKIKGLRYVEGLAMSGDIDFMPFHHGWNLDAQGKVIDNTWCNTGMLYFGVEFALGRAADAIWNGNANVLDDYRRWHPLFHQPWPGEDHAKVWQPNECLRLIERALTPKGRKKREKVAR